MRAYYTLCNRDVLEHVMLNDLRASPLCLARRPSLRWVGDEGRARWVSCFWFGNSSQVLCFGAARPRLVCVGKETMINLAKESHGWAKAVPGGMAGTCS